MPQPPSLKNMSITALGKYVSSLCFNLTKGIERKINPTDKEYQIAKEVCSYFHEKLIELIPNTLVNEVSCKLLTAIDDWWTFEKDLNVVCKNCQLILQEIVRCVIHPLVSEIGPSSNTSYVCKKSFLTDTFQNRIFANLLCTVLPSLNGLKTLNVRYESRRLAEYIDKLFIPETLEAFSGRITDELVEEIASKCPSIKFLNLSQSKNVTDKSIPTILKLKCLVKLDIMNTGFTTDGISELLKGLSENENFKGLSSDVAVKDAEKLIHSQRLVTEGTFRYFYPANPYENEVRKFDNLLSLVVSHRTIVTGDNLFLPVMADIGKNLKYLHLEGISVDTENANEFMQLGKWCRNLVCLHISYDSYVTEQELFIPEIPTFQSLKCFKSFQRFSLFDRIEGISHDFVFLMQCPNLESLTLCWNTCLNKKKSWVKKIFSADVNAFSKLKYIHWAESVPCLDALCCSVSNDNETAQLLIDRCPELKFISGLKIQNPEVIFNDRMVKFHECYTKPFDMPVVNDENFHTPSLHATVTTCP
ncbi:hypothetical protein C0J52_07493 [Blattella germanica]|nr:hypothetical protein C0J52_07493 [Blattella germanica]